MLIWGLEFQRIRVHDFRGKEHNSRHGAGAVAESSHPDPQHETERAH